MCVYVRVHACNHICTCLHVSVLFQDNYKNVYAKIKWENGLLSIVLKEDNKDGAVISASTPIIFQGK